MTSGGKQYWGSWIQASSGLDSSEQKLEDINCCFFPLNPVQPIRSKPNWPAQLQAIKWLYWLFAKYDITFCEYQLVLPQVLQFILPFKMKFCAPKRMIYYNEHPIMWVYERGCVLGMIDNKNPIFSESTICIYISPLAWEKEVSNCVHLQSSFQTFHATGLINVTCQCHRGYQTQSCGKDSR